MATASVATNARKNNASALNSLNVEVKESKAVHTALKKEAQAVAKAELAMEQAHSKVIKTLTFAKFLITKAPIALGSGKSKNFLQLADIVFGGKVSSAYAVKGGVKALNALKADVVSDLKGLALKDFGDNPKSLEFIEKRVSSLCEDGLSEELGVKLLEYLEEAKLGKTKAKAKRISAKDKEIAELKAQVEALLAQAK